MKRVLALALLLTPAVLLAQGSATFAQVSPTASPTPPAPAVAAPIKPQLTPTSRNAQPLEGVAVLVNDQVISFTDVNDRATFLLASLGQTKPDQNLIQQAQRKAIEDLIDEHVQVQEYNKLVKDRPVGDKDIERQLEAVARQNNMTLDAFSRDLGRRGVKISTFREKIRAEIAWQRIMNGRFGRNLRISPLQINDRIAQLQASADKPQYRIGEIFLYAPDEGSRANAKTLAGQLKEQLEQGADFTAVARQFSYAPSASAGGDLGWVTEGELRPEIAPRLKDAAPGKLLDPVETEGGVYLIFFAGKSEPVSPDQARLSMKQLVAKGADAERKLRDAKAKVNTCADVEGAASGVDGVSSVNLGEMALADIAPDFRKAVEPLDKGEATLPVDVDGGKAMIFVCERQTPAGAVPSRSKVEDDIFETQMGMFSERYLRDLKREATIVRK